MGATNKESMLLINATEPREREVLKYSLFKTVDSAFPVQPLKRRSTNMEYLLPVSLMVKAQHGIIKFISSKVSERQQGKHNYSRVFTCHIINCS